MEINLYTENYYKNSIKKNVWVVIKDVRGKMMILKRKINYLNFYIIEHNRISSI